MFCWSILDIFSIAPWYSVLYRLVCYYCHSFILQFSRLFATKCLYHTIRGDEFTVRKKTRGFLGVELEHYNTDNNTVCTADNNVLAT